MHEILTDVLDVIGVILIAVGLGFAAGHWIGESGFAVCGVVILLGSAIISTIDRRAVAKARGRG